MYYYRGLILVEPHGTYIVHHQKNLIIKSKRISSIINQPLLLIENKLGLGIIKLDPPKEISLRQFATLRSRHLITTAEREKWWGSYDKLYAYPIIKTKIFKIPALLDYLTGPQITVKPEHIHFNKILIGTSGLPVHVKNNFSYYSTYLNSVEINYTFYHMPTISFSTNLSKHNLLYTIKIPQLITHYKQLKNIKKIWHDFYQALKPAHEKIICFLFQFNSHFVFNELNLIKLKKLSGLSKLHRHSFAFEFRDQSWFDNLNVIKLFQMHSWILVIVNSTNIANLSNGFNPRLNSYVPTSNLLYFRLHGTTGKYTGSYKNYILNQIKKLIFDIRPTISLIYFNNTDSGDAWPNAFKLKSKFNPLNI